MSETGGCTYCDSTNTKIRGVENWFTKIPIIGRYCYSKFYVECENCGNLLQPSCDTKLEASIAWSKLDGFIPK